MVWTLVNVGSTSLVSWLRTLLTGSIQQLFWINKNPKKSIRMTTIVHFILTVSEKCVTTSAVLLFGLFTAARDWPKPERPNSERVNRVSWGMIFLYCGLGLTAAVFVV